MNNRIEGRHVVLATHGEKEMPSGLLMEQRDLGLTGLGQSYRMESSGLASRIHIEREGEIDRERERELQLKGLVFNVHWTRDTWPSLSICSRTI